MSKSLIYLIGIFALWFYFHIADNSNAKRGDGFDLNNADKAQSGHGGMMANWSESARGAGLMTKPHNEIGGSA